MQTKEFSLDVKSVESDGSFEGYASTFGGAPDSYGDVISPGAFAKCLVEHRRGGTMPLMLFGHAHNDLPIGNWSEMAEDGKGLLAKGQIDLEDAFGSRVHRALKQKRMRGLSIGYETKKSHEDEKRPGVRFLDEIDLWEVSVVNFPANRRSLVEAVKSERMDEFARRLRDGDPMPVKEFEDLLRDAGIPRAMATQIASVGYAKAIRSESEGAKAKDLAALREAVTAFLPTRT